MTQTGGTRVWPLAPPNTHEMAISHTPTRASRFMAHPTNLPSASARPRMRDFDVSTAYSSPTCTDEDAPTMSLYSLTTDEVQNQTKMA